MRFYIDFITNSSSSSIYFLLKKNSNKELFRQLLLHEDKYPIVSNSVNNLIEYLVSMFKNDDPDLFRTRISDISELEQNLVDRNNQIRQYRRDHGDDTLEYFGRAMEEINRKLNVIREAKNKGFKYYIMLSFGDNEGDISGTFGLELESAFSDSNNKMKILEDFVFFSESNR